MKASRWFRAAAVILLLFAFGHTYGFLGFRPASPEGLAVWNSMNKVRFAVGHGTASYGEFYVGFGMFITAFYLFCCWLAWILASMARRASQETKGIAIGLAVLQTVGLGLAIAYEFGPPPTFLSLATTVCLIFGLRAFGKSAGATKPE